MKIDTIYSYWCKTEKLSNKFLRQAKKQGWEIFTWEKNVNEKEMLKTIWNINKENTCYQITSNAFVYYTSLEACKFGYVIKEFK